MANGFIGMVFGFLKEHGVDTNGMEVQDAINKYEELNKGGAAESKDAKTDAPKKEDGWKKLDGATTAPVGYHMESNGKSRFGKDYKTRVVNDEDGTVFNSLNEAYADKYGEGMTPKARQYRKEAMNSLLGAGYTKDEVNEIAQTYMDKHNDPETAWSQIIEDKASDKLASPKAIGNAHEKISSYNVFKQIQGEFNKFGYKDDEIKGFIENYKKSLSKDARNSSYLKDDNSFAKRMIDGLKKYGEF